MADRSRALASGLTPGARFWRDKRVFLTGHSGFKGAWLALWLHRLGARVKGFSLPPDASPRLGEFARIDTLIEAETGDIRDAAGLAASMREFAPDVVLHLAAEALVQRSYREPVQTFETNVIGTVNLLQAVRETASVRSVVIVTTDKCYENREWTWPYRENDQLGGYDPYSASKACAELAVAAWRRSFFNDPAGPAIASARAGNVIGGGDWAENRLIPDCIQALTAGAVIEIRNPSSTRPWQHVLEPLCGYLLLAESLWRDGKQFADAWNFGPPLADIVPVSRIADQVTSLWGDGASWVAAPNNAPHEAGFLALEAAKARSRLDWAPRLTLNDTLSWSIAWYKAHQHGQPAAELISRDIDAYETMGTASRG